MILFYSAFSLDSFMENSTWSSNNNMWNVILNILKNVENDRKLYHNFNTEVNVFLLPNQGSPHIVKTGWLDFSLSWLKGEVRENLGDFQKSIPILTFLSPLPHVPLPFTKRTCVHNDLKKDAINEFGIKYWTSSPVWVIFQEHGSFFYVNIEEKVWLLVKKLLTWKDWQGD